MLDHHGAQCTQSGLFFRGDGMNETQLQMKTLLCHDAYSEGYTCRIQAAPWCRDVQSPRSLSLSGPAHGSCAYRNAFVMFYAPRSMSPDRPAECDDETGRLRWQKEVPGSLYFHHIPLRTAASCFLRSFTTRECQSLSILPREEWQHTFGMNLRKVLFSS